MAPGRTEFEFAGILRQRQYRPADADALNAIFPKSGYFRQFLVRREVSESTVIRG
jgi:hypothetical protein